MSDTWYAVGTYIGMLAWIPWVIILLTRLFRKGQVDFHETVPIQLGYTHVGPLIGLEGVMRAIGVDMFVTKVTLSITKHKDKSIHSFEWWLLRPDELPAVQTTGEKWRSPYPITIVASQSQLHAITFIDLQAYSEIRSIEDRLYEAWNQLRNQTFQGSLYPDPERLRNLFKQFRSSKLYTEPFSHINKLCYWDAGSYSLEIFIHASNPDGVFSKKWQFEITREQIRTFELNVPIILQEVCGLRQSQYRYVPAKLAKTDRKAETP